MRSTINSPIKGKAYEYACVLSLEQIVSQVRPIEILQNSSLTIAKLHFEQDISPTEQTQMLRSSKAGILEIIKMEPRIVQDGSDKLVVCLQPDDIAKKLGDIRDLLIIRRSIEWEIGISVKHNHAALKHSRLSTKLDFGKSWFGVPCSESYFATIKPIFERLAGLRKQRTAWSELADKDSSVYRPVLDAFRAEFVRINAEHEGITEQLLRYLLGSNGRDYYKLIHNNNHTTTIMPFNLFGSLNKSAGNIAPQVTVPVIELPTRIIEFEYKVNSSTTLILTLDNGWSISFRIHNASTVVEASLKFDIKLQSKPEDLFYIDVSW